MIRIKRTKLRGLGERYCFPPGASLDTALRPVRRRGGYALRSQLGSPALANSDDGYRLSIGSRRPESFKEVSADYTLSEAHSLVREGGSATGETLPHRLPRAPPPSPARVLKIIGARKGFELPTQALESLDG